MILQPRNLQELVGFLAAADKGGEKISDVNLSALNGLMEHKAEDMTATVEAGITLAALQKELSRGGQWLPVDPPNPERLSIGALLANNASGPRRFGYGTVRDYVIGLQVALADGRLVRSGGKVVKNVAGYDLLKLFIGSRGSLGVILEVTFKVLPRPEQELFIEAKCRSREEANNLLEAVLNSELTPMVVDLHNGSAAAWPQSTLVVGLAGTREEVEWQKSKAADLGISEPSSLDYAEAFFSQDSSIQKVSVLPSRTIEILGSLQNCLFVARAGNGIIYHTGAPTGKSLSPRTKLGQRLKNEFDPKHLFPDLV